MLHQTTRKQAQPKRFDIFFHALKTCKLVGALLVDPRVHALRKLLFLASLGVLCIVLFFPDVIGETILSTLLPLVGTVIGVPIDVGMDWIAIALLITNLLQIFPAELVAEHYGRIFKGGFEG